MATTKANRKKKPESKISGFLSYTLIVIVAIIATFIASISIASYLRQGADLTVSREEYGALQQFSENFAATTIPAAAPEVSPYVSEFDTQMREMNPDYICWIGINDTIINYPVVRGSDNEKYLNITFSGEENMFGALFMDYRCSGDPLPHIIIYGHNSRQGDMFGGLRDFLIGQYLIDHPTIQLKANDRIVEYEVFSARSTNIYDPAYFLDFSEPDSYPEFLERCGAPNDAVQILTLSTCVSGYNADERVIVQAALR